MAVGIPATTVEVIMFVDSDSAVEEDGLRKLVQEFADQRVAAISERSDVENADENRTARMQTPR